MELNWIEALICQKYLFREIFNGINGIELKLLYVKNIWLEQVLIELDLIEAPRCQKYLIGTVLNWGDSHQAHV